MQASLKPSFAQISRAAQKILSCPKFGRGGGGYSPPARTPMSLASLWIKSLWQFENGFLSGAGLPCPVT